MEDYESDEQREWDRQSDIEACCGKLIEINELLEALGCDEATHHVMEAIARLEENL